LWTEGDEARRWEEPADRALRGFLLVEATLLLLMKLALGDKWRRDTVDAVVFGESG
jgi:hypothetical protein